MSNLLQRLASLTVPFEKRVEFLKTTIDIKTSLYQEIVRGVVLPEHVNTILYGNEEQKEMVALNIQIPNPIDQYGLTAAQSEIFAPLYCNYERENANKVVRVADIGFYLATGTGNGFMGGSCTKIIWDMENEDAKPYGLLVQKTNEPIGHFEDATPSAVQLLEDHFFLAVSQLPKMRHVVFNEEARAVGGFFDVLPDTGFGRKYFGQIKSFYLNRVPSTATPPLPSIFV